MGVTIISTGDLGGDFERRFAEMLGGDPVKGSGSGKFVKGDVRGQDVVFSCKATRNGSFSVTNSTLYEAAQIGRHEGSRHGMAVEIQGDVYVLHPWAEYAQIMAGEETVPLSRSDTKRSEAAVPAALRHEGDG